MSRRSKFIAEEKYKIIKQYEDSLMSIARIANEYNISETTFLRWRYKFETYGMKGLQDVKEFKKYSGEMKESAILDYLSGDYSLMDLTKKYEISNRSVLDRWVKKYNGHSELRGTPKGMSQTMTKGRSTSLKERIEIVQYCIAQKNNYQEAAEVYQVSYQQVYQWVQKYNIGGEDALKDRRGRKKEEEELTTEEKNRLAMKKLEIENERLRAENAFLKKLEELERRRY